MANKVFYLGVEGGASKSTAILSGDDKKIILTRKGKALNYHNIGESALKKNLSELISPLLKRAHGGRLHAVFGFAGLDTPADGMTYAKVVKSLMPKSSKFQVLNDAQIALKARCPGENNRILVISGTGASVYGESVSRSARTVGWGFILGDEGSAYYNGLKALKVAVRSWDGRDKKTLLEGLVLKKLGVSRMEDFMPKFYAKASGGNVKRYIASFSPLVDEAILKKDWAARDIRNEAARELIAGVFSVAKRLNFKGKEFCVGTVGSQWKMPGLLDIFKKGVKEEYKKVYFSDNKDSGAWGAVLLAKKL